MSQFTRLRVRLLGAKCASLLVLSVCLLAPNAFAESAQFRTIVRSDVTVTIPVEYLTFVEQPDSQYPEFRIEAIFPEMGPWKSLSDQQKRERINSRVVLWTSYIRETPDIALDLRLAQNHGRHLQKSLVFDLEHYKWHYNEFSSDYYLYRDQRSGTHTKYFKCYNVAGGTCRSDTSSKEGYIFKLILARRALPDWKLVEQKSSALIDSFASRTSKSE